MFTKVTTNTCPEPDQSSPHALPLRSILILQSHLRLGLPRSFFPLSHSTRSLYYILITSIRATFPAPLIVLDSIVLTIFGKDGKL
jgi:hypothetical protein